MLNYKGGGVQQMFRAKTSIVSQMLWAKAFIII